MFVGLIMSFFTQVNFMHGGMLEVAKYAHWTETETHLGLHQQPKTMTMRHAEAMESTDGAHSRGLGFTCLSQERERESNPSGQGTLVPGGEGGGGSH